jgi:hypothetical protein
MRSKQISREKADKSVMRSKPIGHEKAPASSSLPQHPLIRQFLLNA